MRFGGWTESLSSFGDIFCGIADTLLLFCKRQQQFTPLASLGLGGFAR
jgi:hypothetical protein